MVQYEVIIFTSDRFEAGTSNTIKLKLVGSEKETELITFSQTLWEGEGSKMILEYDCSIGDLEMIEVEKPNSYWVKNDEWFPNKVVVKTPEGKTFTFPIYQWIEDQKVHAYKEGTAIRVDQEKSQRGKETRKNELKQKAQDYKWKVYVDGLPHCIEADSPSSLPAEIQFSCTKIKDFAWSELTRKMHTRSERAVHAANWKSFEDLSNAFSARITKKSEYTYDHWREDVFFASQFLNGINPMVIRLCKNLPENFPVTDKDVGLSSATSLKEEMEKGNIFLCDYKIFDGIEANTINEKKQYLTAPLVLLYKSNETLMPIAIQLKQQPGEDNPIFFPSDPENDWLLAKAFVRSADFNYHQFVVHMLHTHLLCQVFAVSLLRNLPMVHPLYKLLIPHTRYTLYINAIARDKLLSKDEIIFNHMACGGDSMLTILQKAMPSVTYASLCIKDDIAERGLEKVKRFYYRNDGFLLWDEIQRFVKEILAYYYKDDSEVQKDPELQNWIRDIYEHGFLSKPESGIPREFTSVEELIKFVTMVIFTGSAQHAAVNHGQFDYGAWMPNAPSTMQQPPPTKKGEATEATLLETFPDVETTLKVIDVLKVLTDQSRDFIPLGHYPEEHFTEEHPRNKIRCFQEKLKMLNIKIESKNNNSRFMPYSYMVPKNVENSVAI